MPSRTKYVLLSLLAGLLAFAVAGFLGGYYIGSGPRHPHAFGPVITGAFIGLYAAPVGGVVGLIAALIIKNRTWKKMALILGITFVLTAVASAFYVWTIIR